MNVVLVVPMIDKQRLKVIKRFVHLFYFQKNRNLFLYICRNEKTVEIYVHSDVVCWNLPANV